MNWSLYKGKNSLKPLVFSNGKSQLNVAEEVVNAIKDGHKLIFIKGVCGTGKSSIALNIAKEIGRSSIVVPVKVLQKQYKEDYTENLYVLKDDGNKLKITVIDGRNNHSCAYMEGSLCDDKDLPCNIELKKENIDLIKDYIRKNPFVKAENIFGLQDVRRKTIAPVCPNWSPIICNEWFDTDYTFKDADTVNYKGLNNKTFTFNRRGGKCGYYNQFMSYVDSDVIVFNSKKYELETVMDRKPLTEVEIIDECDEFLDSLSTEKKINFNRLSRTLSNIITTDSDLKKLTIELNDFVINFMNDTKVLESIHNKNIYLAKNTRIVKLFEYFLNNSGLVGLNEEENSDYLEYVYNISKYFENFMDEAYLTFHRDDHENLIATLITVNLEKRLKEFLDKNKVFVMMSGTVHEPKVLQEIFGIKEFKIIEAETKHPGKVTKISTGLEKWFNYQMMIKDGAREWYLKALSKCLEKAKRPTLAHVNAFSDLPTEDECDRYHLDNVKTREDFIQEQDKYKHGELVQMFKKKEIPILYSTKCTRGIDLPGEICNSIIFTRYPYPQVSSLFWRVLKECKPKESFDLFYFDKAKREFLQRVYRGLRHKDDKVDLLSPDLRVLDAKI